MYIPPPLSPPMYVPPPPPPMYIPPPASPIQIQPPPSPVFSPQPTPPCTEPRLKNWRFTRYDWAKRCFNGVYRKPTSEELKVIRKIRRETGFISNPFSAN